MAINEQELTNLLRTQFFSDSEELVADLARAAIQFAQSSTESIRAMLRILHNLKGAAQLSGFQDFAKRLHDWESAFEQISTRELTPEDQQVCVLYVTRLGILIPKFFDELKGGAPTMERDQVDWNHALAEILKLIPNESNVDKKPTLNTDDDWGLSEIVKTDPSTELHPDAATTPATVTATQDKGWGLFADEEIKHAPIVTPSTPHVLAPLIGPQGTDKPAPSMTTLIPPKTEKMREVYLLCRNENASFALPVKYVQEILPDRPHKPLPISRKGINGVISFRGRIMAILALLDKEKPSMVSGRCIVVCQIERKQFGFRVDQVQSVIDVENAKLEPIPGGSDEGIIRNLASIDGDTVSFIDPRFAVGL